MNTYLYIIGTLAAIIVGGSAFAVWFVVSENADRRKHYKITLTAGPDGTLHVYKGKLVETSREALTIVPGTEDMIADVDIRLIDGAATVTDLRVRKVR
jgi:hypothetical protein